MTQCVSAVDPAPTLTGDDHVLIVTCDKHEKASISEIGSAINVAKGNWINIADYGALGNDSYDNATRIGNAVAFLNVTGGTLYIPPGIYRCSATLSIHGPPIVHQVSEAPYYGNWQIVGSGSASVLKYTGAGTFITTSGTTGAPSNIVLRDLQIRGPSSSPWSTATTAVEFAVAGTDTQMDNVQISNFALGVKAQDQTNFGMRLCAFRACKLGVGGAFKFDGVTLEHVSAQDCDVGIDLGYYYSGGSACPPTEGLTMTGGSFGHNRISIIVGGSATRGVNLKGLYFEASTESDIDIGHNTTDYSGNQLEVSAVEAVNIEGCYFQSTVTPIRIWRQTYLKLGINGYNAAVSPFVKLENASADSSTIESSEHLVSNFLQTSTGTTYDSSPLIYNRPVQVVSTNSTFTSSEIGGITINGALFPGLITAHSGSVKGYGPVVVTTGAGFFSDSTIDDLVFRSEVSNGKLMFGNANASASTFWVSQAMAAFNLPLRLASYAKAALPSASTVGQMIYVTDDTGGAVPAFSDGTNWRRVTDRNVIS